MKNLKKISGLGTPNSYSKAKIDAMVTGLNWLHADSHKTGNVLLDIFEKLDIHTGLLKKFNNGDATVNTETGNIIVYNNGEWCKLFNK